MGTMISIQTLAMIVDAFIRQIRTRVQLSPSPQVVEFIVERGEYGKY